MVTASAFDATRSGRMPHSRRRDVDLDEVQLVTVKCMPGVWGLREKAAMARLRRCFREGKVRGTFRLLHWVVLNNHMHFVVEAESRPDLSNGMNGLLARIAKGMNAHLGRTGRFWKDRFHVQPLRTALEISRGLRYVLDNFTKHRNEWRSGDQTVPWGDPRQPDPCSSARYLRWSSRSGAGAWFRLPEWCYHDAPIARPRGRAMLAAELSGRTINLGDYATTRSRRNVIASVATA